LKLKFNGVSPRKGARRGRWFQRLNNIEPQGLRSRSRHAVRKRRRSRR
jgi:hypothetical protein